MPPLHPQTERVLGKNTKVWMTRYDYDINLEPETHTELTYVLRGFDGIDLNEAEDQVEIAGGGGQVGSQRTGYKEDSKHLSLIHISEPTRPY